MNLFKMMKHVEEQQRLSNLYNALEKLYKENYGHKQNAIYTVQGIIAQKIAENLKKLK